MQAAPTNASQLAPANASCDTPLTTPQQDAVPWEIAAICISLAVMALYILAWQYQTKSHPLRTLRGRMEAARRSWITANMGKGMLPVNTLRDLIRINQFYASSSLLVALGAAGFATSTDGILRFKVLCLVALTATTSILFLQAVRFYGHCEILLNTPDLGDGVPVTAELCYATMNRATSCGSAGQKGLMMTVPLLFWVFGPIALVLSTIALVVTLRVLEWDDAGHRALHSSQYAAAAAAGAAGSGTPMADDAASAMETGGDSASGAGGGASGS